MEKDIRAELFQSVIDFARATHAELIDAAYEYFWEEDDPEDFFGGTALGLAFINFEDWFVCDYRTAEGDSIIDLYQGASEDLPEKDMKALEAMKHSHISIYEVVSSEAKVTLKDLLLGGEFSVSNESLRSLSPGDIFASRFVGLGGEFIMSRCVYPFTRSAKDRLLEYVDMNFKRFVKNKNPDGTMQDFVKEESYLFNLLWLDNIFKSRRTN